MYNNMLSVSQTLHVSSLVTRHISSCTLRPSSVVITHSSSRHPSGLKYGHSSINVPNSLVCGTIRVNVHVSNLDILHINSLELVVF